MSRILLLLLGLLPAVARAQAPAEAFEAALLPTKTGALLVYNGSQHTFSVQLTGRVVPGEKPSFLTLNGQLVQAAIIGYGSNGDVADLPEDTQKKFLISYQQHEDSYFKKELKVPVTNEKTAFVHFNNHLFLSWEYDTPFRGKNKVQRQLYLVAICFNQALVLNCPIARPTEAAPAQALLTAIASTLVLKNEPVDLKKLYEELQK